MSRTGKRGLIRTLVLATAATAIAVAAMAGAGAATAHSSPPAHHALADNGVLTGDE
jgi:hypothetical protein